ncbi:MAG TPA: pyrrolo-quinoline quinone [Candidatus Angelobacter sp.]|jgi:hypothetical protein
MLQWVTRGLQFLGSSFSDVAIILLLAGLMAGCGGVGHSTSDSGSGPSPTPTATPVTTAPSGYLTWKNDNGRTGLQANETALTPANVNATQFGLKFSVPVDGWIYAQPLYVAGVTIGGAKHNVVFVATEHDTVFAFDADAAGPPLWTKSFLGPGITTVQTSGNHDIPMQPEAGITGTPVIDASAGTIFVAAQTVENGIFMNKLHALDVTSGAERPGSPVELTDGAFDPKQEFQRTALLLANGNVYVAFASYGDIDPYHGYMFAFNAGSLGKVAAWNVTPTASEGGIWMGGAGPAADQNGNIFVVVGNGTFDGTTNFGQSVVKLDSGLHVTDFFAPFNANQLNIGDHDLGAGGVLLVPDQSGTFPHELIACGKNDPIFVVNRDNMGHQNPADNNQIIQSVLGQVGGGSGLQDEDHCFSTAAFFNQKLFLIGNNDVIKAFSLDGPSGKLSTNAVAKGSFTFVFPGGQPVVSANGVNNGIVWAVDNNPASALHAFDANDVSHELYTSPTFGQASKWAVPTVINGKVYIPTKTKLVVFGLN